MPHELNHLTDDFPQLHMRHSLRRRMTWDRRLPSDVVSALWQNPKCLLHSGQCLQTKSRTEVARVDSSCGAYLLKFHHWAGVWKTLSKSRAESPNRFSFDLGVEVANAGVPTPRPLACVDVRLGPFNICSYLLTEFVEGTSLYRLLRYDRPDAAQANDLARQVARIWQSLDDLQLSHNDLKPENFMVDPSGHVWLIDLENARRHKDKKSLHSCQTEDLRRLLHVRSWQANPAAAEIFRQRLRETPAVQAAIADPGGEAHPLAHGASVAGVESQRLTVLIPCGAAAVRDLSGCVEAVRDFADEILLAIPDGKVSAWVAAENLTDCRTWWCEHFDAETLRRAIASAHHPWVLVVEPNERVSPDLAKEIQFLLAEIPTKNGYRIERRNYLFGRAMRFGELAVDMPVRLVQRDSELLPAIDDIRGAQQQNSIGKLRCRIFRNRAASVDEWTAELADRTDEVARELYASGKHSSLAQLAFAAPRNFVRSYFFNLGFLDGVAGLRAATISAAFEFVKNAKLRRLQHSSRRPASATSRLPSLRVVQPDLIVEPRPIAGDGDGQERRAAA